MDIINKYIRLYNEATPILNGYANTVDYNIFKLDKNIRFCNSQELLKYIPTGNNKRIESIRNYISYNPFFYMIPLKTIDENIFGFVFKSDNEKQYRNIINSNCKLQFYGWDNFKNYDRKYPIILTEGIKDCLIVRKFYPYVLSCLTSGLSEDGFNLFNNITNKIILCYDNDKTGYKRKSSDSLSFIKRNMKVSVISNYPAKDPGDLYNNIIGQKILKNSIEQSILSLI